MSESGKPADCTRRFRRSGPRWWVTACAAAFLVIPLSGLFAAGPDGHDEPSLVQQAICLPLAVFLLWTTIGVARQGIWLSENDVRIRNIYRTYRLTWAQTVSISSPLSYGAMRNAGIQFKLVGGRTVNAALYSAGPLNRPGFADDVMAHLQACHEQARADETRRT